MKGGNKNSRRKSAIERRTEDLKEYVTTKNTDKATKAFRDIVRTYGNLKEEVPQDCLNLIKSIGIDPNKITSKTHNSELKELAE